MNVVVFSGTTEGRELSRQLAALGIEVTVSVATPLGQEEQGSTPGVTVRCGRLLPDEMAALLGDAALCIDATHPYAVEATKNIKAAAEKAGVEYLRLLRPASPLPENCLVFESAKQAAEALAARIAAFPQACLRSDRRAALRQHGLPLREALALEFAEGLPSLHAEGVAGAARFADGAGRHGRFED